MMGATNATTQLMELCQAKAVSLIDKNRIGGRNINARFDDGGTHKNIETF